MITLMTYINLGGHTTPIPVATWSGPVIPEMTGALLRGEFDIARQAYDTWATITGVQAEIPTFPVEDFDALVTAGRPNLARMLLKHGLFSENPNCQ